MPTPFQRLAKKCEEMELEIKRLKGLDQDANQQAVNELISNEDSNSERQAGMHNPKAGFARAAREVIQKSDRARQKQEELERKIRR